MRYAARTDGLHAEIRDTLRALGWLVADTSRLGGWVDLVAVKGTRYGLIEVKTALSAKGRVRKTRRQEDMQAQGWPITILRTRDEAITWATER
jgi:Holliday junction resolvase